MAWAVAIALLLARIAYVVWLMPYGLGPDEAQYWHWTSHMDWSYLSKPPLTTTAIWLSTAVFGDTLLGVKLFALISQSAVALLGFGMAGLIGGTTVAWAAFALFSTLPLVAGGGLLMSPDALLLPLWMGALFIIMRTLPSNTPVWGPWLLVGLLVGLAGLAKYTAVLCVPLVGLFVLLERPRWLLHPQPYAAALLALALQTPVVYWNLTHGMDGLTHVLWQTDGGGDTRHGGLATLADFMGGQALVLGPFTLLALIVVWGYKTYNYKTISPYLKLILIATLPLFAAFAAQTLQAKVQPNWPLLGTVPAMVLLAVALGRLPRWGMVALGLMLATNTALSLALHDTRLLAAVGIALPHKNDPTKDLQGWNDMGQLVGLQLARLDNPVLLTSRYQTTAQLAFHTTGQPLTLYMNDGTRRPVQYDLWPWPALDNRLVVYVNEAPTLPAAVKARFGQCEPWTPLEVERGGTVLRHLNTWLCWTTTQA